MIRATYPPFLISMKTGVRPSGMKKAKGAFHNVDPEVIKTTNDRQ